MLSRLTLPLLAAAVLALGACASDSQSTAPTGSSGSMTAAAESACFDAVMAQGGSTDLRVTSSEFSEANSLVMLQDASGTWRCLASNDGVVADLSFAGAAASGTGTPTSAEQACLAAVSREANNGDVAVLSSDFSQAGTYVTIGVGEERAPWRCIAYSDGTTDGVQFMGDEGAL